MQNCLPFLCALLALAIEGCGNSGQLPDLPPLPTNPPIQAVGAGTPGEIYVTNSVPVTPGSRVEIIDQSGPKLLVSNALVGNVRWKVDGPFMSPSYPARGFVAVALTKNQWEAVQLAQDISVRPSK
jgi:hypothetical protein